LRGRLACCVTGATALASLSAAAPASAAAHTRFVGGPEDGSSTNDPTPTFGFVSDEPSLVFTCTLDAQLPFVCRSPLTLPALGDGDHALAVSGVGLGGIDAPAVRAFTVDTLAPGTTITDGPPDGAMLTDGRVSFAWTSPDDAVSFDCSVEHVPIASCDSAFTTPASNGSHSFSVAAVDEAGNVDQTPATSTFTVAARGYPPTPQCPVSGAVGMGTSAAEALTGDTGSDLLFGSGGDDVLYGWGGRDCLYGGAGDDRLFGGTANDVLQGGPGADTLTDGRGRDTFIAGPGNDRIDARDATTAGARIADKISCGPGHDVAHVDRADHFGSGCDVVIRGAARAGPRGGSSRRR
jgi:hypothetical protein